ncbi:hypothetical protein WJR50_22065 [Catalinimonas sp. 4WD22]|uniref:hypothetical protein n=1 Tax=Catalinimonas locisalis TaxID=3133978 RepID=UPI00310183C4
MRITIFICGMAFLEGLLCCTPVEKELTRKHLEGRWEFLGYWKDTKLQQDTLKVYFFESDSIISMDTHAYDVVTDSGIWKFTVVKENSIIAAEPHPFYTTLRFENDSTAYIRNADSTDFLIGQALQVKLKGGEAIVYADALIDETLMDTLVQAYEGNLEIGPADTLQIHWGHGITAKWKRKD